MAAKRIEPSLSRERMEHFHRNARALRTRLNVFGEEPIDPFALAETFGIRIRFVDGLDVKDFSGHLAWKDGQPHVLLNRQQTPERANVTLLEEICHLHYQHPLSALSDDGHEADPVVEQEAYQTAAAVLLPPVVIAKAVYRGTPLAELARAYGASLELVEMRVKVMGLWRELKDHKGKGAAA